MQVTVAMLKVCFLDNSDFGSAVRTMLLQSVVANKFCTQWFEEMDISGCSSLIGLQSISLQHRRAITRKAN